MAKAQHHQRDVPVPAVSASGLVVIKPKLGRSRLEAVLDRPASPFHRNQRLNPGSGWTPGREEGPCAIGNVAADQQAPRPEAGAVAVVFGGLEIRQFAIGPVPQSLTLGALTGRQALPPRSVETLRDLLGRAGPEGLVAPGVDGVGS